jgi:guanylate kinase
MEREPSLRFSVSYTTRKPRANERAGKDYHFVDTEQFQAMVANGEFLEHAQVFDNFYGTALRTVQDSLANGDHLLLEIDWQGADQIRTRLPEARSIFILPPSRRALEQRLRQRSTDSEEVIARRLRDSVGDMGHWSDFDYVVVNDRFEKAVGELHEIVLNRGENLRGKRPEIVRLAAELLG